MNVRVRARWPPIGAAALLALACAAPPPAFQTHVGADDPLVGRIYDVAGRRFVAPRDVVARATRADFVLLGEKHDNADHHRLQAWLIEQLARAGRRPALVFEMIRGDRADALRGALASAPEDPDAVALALDWAGSGWPEFALYRPIFATALDARLPLAAGDLSSMALSRLRRGGLASLPADERARLALDPGPSASVRLELAAEIRAAHCGFAPEARLDAMIDLQRARDAVLADSLLDAATLHGAVLIAGAGHVRGAAVPLYLERRATPRVVFALAFTEAPREADVRDDLERQAARLGAGFDVIWITPRVDDEDPCSKFQPQLERLRP